MPTLSCVPQLRLWVYLKGGLRLDAVTSLIVHAHSWYFFNTRT